MSDNTHSSELVQEARTALLELRAQAGCPPLGRLENAIGAMAAEFIRLKAETVIKTNESTPQASDETLG